MKLILFLHVGARVAALKRHHRITQNILKNDRNMLRRTATKIAPIASS